MRASPYLINQTLHEGVSPWLSESSASFMWINKKARAGCSRARLFTRELIRKRGGSCPVEADAFVSEAGRFGIAGKGLSTSSPDTGL